MDTITITILMPSGGLELSTMHNGFLVSRRYYGHTPKSATADFKDHLKNDHRRNNA